MNKKSVFRFSCFVLVAVGICGFEFARHNNSINKKEAEPIVNQMKKESGNYTIDDYNKDKKAGPLISLDKNGKIKENKNTSGYSANTKKIFKKNDNLSDKYASVKGYNRLTTLGYNPHTLEIAKLIVDQTNEYYQFGWNEYMGYKNGKYKSEDYNGVRTYNRDLLKYASKKLSSMDNAYSASLNDQIGVAQMSIFNHKPFDPDSAGVKYNDVLNNYVHKGIFKLNNIDNIVLKTYKKRMDGYLSYMKATIVSDKNSYTAILGLVSGKKGMQYRVLDIWKN